MSTLRYRTTLLILALSAAPLGQLMFTVCLFFIRTNQYPELLTWDKLTEYFRLSAILGFLPAAYFFGLFPTVYVLLALTKAVRKKRAFSILKVYLIALVLAILPWLALTLMTGRIHGYYAISIVLTSAISATLAFFILLPIGKKLLRWAGISLIEPTKAGTP